jgi:hypothetical protein
MRLLDEVDDLQLLGWRGASCLISPIRDHAFFEQPQFKGLLGDDFLQVLRLAPELLDLIRRSRPCGVPREPAFAGFKKLLRQE